eukprot:gene7437-8213_t
MPPGRRPPRRLRALALLPAAAVCSPHPARADAVTTIA